MSMTRKRLWKVGSVRAPGNSDWLVASEKWEELTGRGGYHSGAGC